MESDLLILAGAGQYPRLIAEGARAAGVKRLGVISFRGQTDRRLARMADVAVTFGVGEIARIQSWIASQGFPHVVLAGQISPSALFATRFDELSRSLLRQMKAKNAHSLFGTVAHLIEEVGVRVLPASVYMDACLPSPGVLTARAPDDRELADIRRGLDTALALGTVDVGQTAVVKDGMVVAVEAFEGTNAAIRRGARYGGRGCVVVKAARVGHDMRFDIPVIGAKTLRRLVLSRVSCLAFQAGRTILLDREEVVRGADRHGIAIVSLETDLPAAPTRP